nr:DUF1707 domain-containing protein [Brevibacterium sp. 91QC2O2]
MEHVDEQTPAEEPAHRAPRVRAADSDRDAVLDVLALAHAAGRLNVGELDERQTGAMRAKYIDELPALLADLPEGRELHARYTAQTAGGGLGAGHGLQVPGTGHTPATSGENNLPVLPGAGRARNQVDILSGGDLELEAGTPELSDYALMGGSNIHLRQVMGPGVLLTLNLYSLMGGHDIFVPAGVRVVDETINIMAGNTIRKSAQGDGSQGTLVLKGFSVMAGHTVKLEPEDKRRLTR